MKKIFLTIVLIAILTSVSFGQYYHVQDIMNKVYRENALAVEYKPLGDVWNAIYDATNEAIAFTIEGDSIQITLLKVDSLIEATAGHGVTINSDVKILQELEIEHSLATTEQLRLGYDATNYMTVTIADDGLADFVTVDPDGAEADICFNPDGYVGILNTTPSYELDVTGQIRASVQMFSPTYLSTDGNCFFGGEDDVGLYCDYNANDAGTRSIIFGTGAAYVGGGTELARIKETGEFGIGTASPAYKLHIDGGNIALGDTTTGDNDAIIYFADDGNAAAKKFWFDDGDDQFEINDAFTTNNNQISGSYFVASQGHSVSDGGFVGVTSNERIIFHAAGYIEVSGANLGIGTADPVAKIDASIDTAVFNFGDVGATYASEMDTNVIRFEKDANDNPKQIFKSNTGSGHFIVPSYVQTTDGNATTIYTLAVATNCAYRIIANVIGAQDDGSNSMGATHSFTIKDVAGTVTEQGDVSIQETDDSAGVSISGAVSGTDYLIQVTGIAAENWNWEVSLDVTVVAH